MHQILLFALRLLVRKFISFKSIAFFISPTHPCLYVCSYVFTTGPYRIVWESSWRCGNEPGYTSSGVTIRPNYGDEIGQPLTATSLCVACHSRGSNVGNGALTLLSSASGLCGRFALLFLPVVCCSCRFFRLINFGGEMCRWLDTGFLCGAAEQIYAFCEVVSLV